MSLKDNPFVKLFDSYEEALKFVEQNRNESTAAGGVEKSASPPEPTVSEEARTPEQGSDLYLLDKVFLMTLKGGTNRLRMLDLSNITAEETREGNLAYLVYERLMAAEEIKQMVKERPRLGEFPAFETDSMKYLAECYTRLCSQNEESQTGKSQDSSDLDSKCLSLIMEQASVLVEYPSLLLDFSPTDHLKSLIRPSHISSPEVELQLQFYARLAATLSSSSSRVLEAFRPVLDSLLSEVSSLVEVQGSSGVQLFRFPTGLHFFSRNAELALVLLQYDKELVGQKSSPEMSLLGRILSLGSSSKFFSMMSDYMDDPRSLTAASIAGMEDGVHGYLNEIQTGVHQFFHKLLKSGEDVKRELLLWTGDAIRAYRDRSKLWNIHMSLLLPNSSSDNFLLNLQAVLLKSFAPFLSDPCSDEKIRLVQPTYCSAASDDREAAISRNVHMSEIPGTRLVPSGSELSTSRRHPADPSEASASASSVAAAPPTLLSSSSLEKRYTLASELFFMTHSCFAVGFSVVHEKFTKLSQEMNQIRERYKALLDQGLGNSEAGTRLKEQLRIALPVFYSCKASLMQPELLEDSFRFCVLTANFLDRVATATQGSPSSMTGARRFPSPGDTSGTALCHIPEHVVQNVHGLLVLLRRSKDSFFEEHHEHLGCLFDFILLFMSGPQFVHNPHLRAELGEALECLFPRTEQEDPYRGALLTSASFNNFYREKLLSEHPSTGRATASIMELFVGMELTGQGVQFENKFRYRQPMYVMFKKLWGLEKHKKALVDLAKYAENHLGDDDAPLFLRFVHLLVSDATYLLDEALSLMSQIKEKSAREEEWASLPAAQRQEAENSFRHLSLLARFHNIMALETIETLANLTSVVGSIFTRPVLADRLAPMLNYFLLHLVGPKKRNLKVKNPEEYRFEPRRVVVEICRIYENLSVYEDFLRAVSRDGRSYSHDLFELASDVLCKIKEPVERISRFKEISKKIEELAMEGAAEEEELSDVPEDFLDPILGTIMRDPVLLPSSGKIVDRQTIARHVLSDQSDPFNRQPLTMNMIRPAEELKARIEEWIAQNRSR